MNAAPSCRIPELAMTGGPPRKLTFAKGAAPILLSAFVHVAAACAALVLSAGGTGMEGSGLGPDQGTGDHILISRLVSLQSGSFAGVEAVEEAVAPAAEANLPTQRPEPDMRMREPEQPPAEAVPRAEAVPVVKKTEPAPKQREKRPEPAVRKTDTEKKAEGSEAKRESMAVPGMRAEAAGHRGPDNAEGISGGGGISAGTGTGGEGGERAGTGRMLMVDTKPKVLRRAKVVYPELARKRKITGHVLLRFHLDEKGEVSQLQVVKAEPPGVFEDAAIAAIKHWDFAPATKDGKPVSYWVELPMPFILK